uniref:Ionotropic receptor n=1 Tax=Leucinodes orbonalis TaxID=711050 RepID=A0AAU0QMR3_9NEOP|nr:ionotropic receptor [Leucinodes orbonalis]
MHYFSTNNLICGISQAPPWHFVKYNNDSTVNVTGGRDDKLLSLLSHKLNFRYRYYDPPDRSQGSSISGNGSFKGTLGLIWKRNGTGVYGRLARLMRRQRVQRVRSVEVGVRLVLTRRHVAILGGRETLYYDTERFGSHNFHLSEKLYTRYSAIALQIGCPYLETFNNVVMTLFEAGILGKMTTDEYRNLPEQSRRSEPVTESDKPNADVTGDAPAASQSGTTQGESTKTLQPVSLRMLRGAFCLLGIGHLLAAIALVVEVQIHRRSIRSIKIVEQINEGKSNRKFIALNKARMFIGRGMRNVVRVICRSLDRALGPGI